MLRRVRTQVAVAAAVPAPVGCGRRAADYAPAIAADATGTRTEFTFAVLPLHNPQLPPAARQAVAQALFDLSRTPEGRDPPRRIDVSAFTPATEATYAPVVAFLKTFEAAGGADPPSTESR